MVQTEQMPKSIHGDIAVDAIGEALLKHYNVGITNPWFELGLSDKETYNRRKLPWAGKNFTVDTDNGTVSGPGSESLPDGLVQQWIDFAEEAESVLGGNEYGDLESLYNDGLTNMSP